MAEEIIVRLKDDLDPEQIAEHVVIFGLNGRWFRIDLTDQHKQLFDAALAPYSEHGRPASEQDLTAMQKAKFHNKADRIRNWALAQDPPLPVENGKRRGRGFEIPPETRAAFEARHNSEGKVA
jgi:hypothetical protein